ncbi:HPr kinase/phosphorylase [Hoeflea poritis]|uniref:HPr kinase/phosphatase C-terminal domain-containing protein n=1 Tax=Hoeflea poritis TaxID=2993659 RepID=A0ABT4VKT0_9HYPH|nr:HPr kinase/phosphatase C-terminal domain-containing protein [Hoeflea poritis]MDA4845316.1 HPr kinase/phosphatase C-terminal domain-containing protein [Hoeflea poritis]
MPEKTTDKLPNIHATALVVGETGVLIVGPPGSGKSRLAEEFIQSACLSGRFAALVADDQVFLKKSGKCVVAVAPEPIRGLMEMRGTGIIRKHHLERAVMHIAVSVEYTGKGERFPDPSTQREVLPGLYLPLVFLQPGRLMDPFALLAARLENRLFA